MQNILSFDVFFIKSKADLSENAYSHIEGSFFKIWRLWNTNVTYMMSPNEKHNIESKNPERNA